MVFDTPGWPDEPVEARWDRLRTHFTSLSSDEMQTPPSVRHLGLLTQSAGVYFVEQVQCTGQAHLDAVLQHVLECGGEGYVDDSHQRHAPPPCIIVRVPAQHGAVQAQADARRRGACAGL